MATARPVPRLEESPFIVFWETTRACDLVCKHCRADAHPGRDPQELTFEEGTRLLDDVRAMGCPLVVLTGGDPAKRPDLVELVRHGSSIGLHMALTPSATPLVTRGFLARLADAGLARLAVSLDGLSPASHDGFRGVAGSHARTLEILRDARELGLTTQVNTTVTDLNVADLEAIAAILSGLDITLWSVFFLVPTGRGEQLRVLAPDVAETVLQRIATISATAPFDVKTTAAPHFRRVLLERKAKGHPLGVLSDVDEHGNVKGPRGVNDGVGMMFISHHGEVFPSGFLPISVGNVRRGSLAMMYRESPLFKVLRDVGPTRGKCAVCPFIRVCGGSRARAYIMDGGVDGSDPACAYIPKNYPALPSTRGDTSTGK